MDTNTGLSEETIAEIASHYEAIIRLIGEDPTREGLVKTPMRAARALAFATRGYRQDADEIINEALFENDGARIIIVKNIEFHSLCEHHILPFFGTISVGYLPGEKTIGLSKLARLVDFYARRLQVQERLTAQICRLIGEKLGAKGVIASCTASHLCMRMRGVEKQAAVTTTLDWTGEFDSRPDLRAEFLRSISADAAGCATL